MTCEEIMREQGAADDAATELMRARQAALRGEADVLRARAQGLPPGVPGNMMVAAYYYARIAEKNDLIVAAGREIDAVVREPERRKGLLRRLLQADDYRHVSRRNEGLHVYRVERTSPTGCLHVAGFPDTPDFERVVRERSTVSRGGMMGNSTTGVN